jgi:hypothetical protein
MTVINGCNVAVDTESTVAQWAIAYERESAPVSASNTDLGVLPVCGVKDWMGNYLLSGHTPAGATPAVFFPGYTKTFTGSVDGTQGVTGSAIGKSIAIHANPGQGTPIMTQVEFEGNGELTVGGAVAVDSTEPQWFCPGWAKVQLFTFEWADLADDIQSWVLRFTAANTPYVSTGTSQGRRRIRGPFSGDASVVVLTDDPTNFPTVGSYYKLRFFVAEELYWEVLYMRMRRLLSQPTHPSARNEPVAWTLEFEFSCNDGVVAEPVMGEVNTPDSTKVWPYPA